MNRNSVCSATFFASVLVVLVSALSACTDPNTMQASDPHGASADSRDIDRTPRR